MKSLIEDYGKAKRIVLLDKLFGLDDKPVFHYACIIHFGYSFVT